MVIQENKVSHAHFILVVLVTRWNISNFFGSQEYMESFLESKFGSSYVSALFQIFAPMMHPSSKKSKPLSWRVSPIARFGRTMSRSIAFADTKLSSQYTLKIPFWYTVVSKIASSSLFEDTRHSLSRISQNQNMDFCFAARNHLSVFLIGFIQEFFWVLHFRVPSNYMYFASRGS